MAREIILDTETTGLDPLRGHRLIEVGCVEIEDLLPTGRTFHRLMDPERLIEPDAIRIHGINDDMVRGKPRFGDLCDELLEFIGDSVVVAHNAAFDRGFINFELGRVSRAHLPEERWVDTLKLAQARFPGMYNSLDALCKRFRISLAEREKHGALIDARLLAAVYLELRGGKERGLDLGGPRTARAAGQGMRAIGDHGPRPRVLAPRSTLEERALHADFIAATLKDGGLWKALLNPQESEDEAA